MRQFIIEAILNLWWANELAESPYVTVWAPICAGTPYNEELGKMAATLWGIMDDTPYKNGQIPGEELVGVLDLTPQQESLLRCYKVASIIRSDAFWEWFIQQKDVSLSEYPGLETLYLDLRELSDLRVSKKETVSEDPIWRIAEVVEWPHSERMFYLEKGRIHNRVTRRLGCTKEQLGLWLEVLSANVSWFSMWEVPTPILEGGLEFWHGTVVIRGNRRQELALRFARLARALLALVKAGIHTSPKGDRLAGFYERMPILGDRLLSWPIEDLEVELNHQIAFWEERAEEARFREPVAR